ncbi:MAG: CopD family protein [Anaerolineae bacterium]|nr:CopD family protein [Anaerolineae bacterium]
MNRAPAEAHGYILRAIPAPQSVVEHAPTRIQIWFSESIEAKFSTMSLTTERGEKIALTEVGTAPNNPAHMVGQVPSELPNGAYVVRVRAAFASDGHVEEESYLFWVGAKTDAVANAESDRSASPLEIVWRSLQLPALNVLFGLLLLYHSVLLPGWGNERYRIGGLPPRVMSRLTLAIWIALIVAVISTGIAVMQQSITLFATDASSVLRDGLWGVVLDSTQIGNLLRWRLILLTLAILIHAGSWYASSRLPEMVKLLWWVNLFVAGAILATLSFTSHATGATLWALPATVVDWLHFAATSAWVGGLVTLSVVVPAALQPLDAPARAMALRAALKRFSAVAAVALGLLITTGIFSAAIQIQSAGEVPTSAYGQTLLFKVLLIAPMVLLGAYHHLVVAPGRLAAVAAKLPLSDKIGTLFGSVRLEAVIGVPVLIAAAVLSSTPPPVPANVSSTATAVSQAVDVGEMRVQLALDPGAVGGNGYEVTVLRNDKPLDNAEVWARFVYPSLDRRSQLLKMDNVGSGVYIGAGSELNRVGAWTASVDVIEADGTMQRAAFAWDVPSTPPNTTNRQPNALNWLSLAAILAMFVVWLIPPAWRRIRVLPWQLESVMIGIASTIALIVVLIIGGGMMSEAFARADRQRNLPPDYLNATFPDENSVARGREIFAAQCAECHTPDQQVTFTRRLPELSDDELYAVLLHGKGKMEAIPMDALSEADRWNVINYLRSAAFAEAPAAAR